MTVGHFAKNLLRGRASSDPLSALRRDRKQVAGYLRLTCGGLQNIAPLPFRNGISLNCQQLNLTVRKHGLNCTCKPRIVVEEPANDSDRHLATAQLVEGFKLR